MTITQRKNTIKASSLSNSIFICLIVSVFCGCLVLTSHFQNILNTKIEMSNHLIIRNESSFNYFLNTAHTFSTDEIQKVDVFEDGIYSYAYKKSWGFFDVLICKTIFKNDTIKKSALIGIKKNESNKTALYATNYDKTLKLSGKTKLIGDLVIPNGKVEESYINGQGENNITTHGKQTKSKNTLPKIDRNISIPIAKYKTIPLSSITSGTLINSFDKDTKVIQVTDVLNNITIKGNIILTSSNLIEIESTALLHDVLVIAPKVILKSGVKGNFQIISKQNVILEEEVSLQYPSSIYIKNDIDSVQVTFKKDAKLAGGLIIDGTTYNGSLKRKLILNEKSLIVGDVYCYGNTQLQGEIIGSIYSNRFFLKTESLNHENVILNGTVNRDSLPNNFVSLPLFKKHLSENYEVIKTF